MKLSRVHITGYTGQSLRLVAYPCCKQRIVIRLSGHGEAGINGAG